MIAITETTDHDCGPAPLHMPPLGVLVPTLIDGHRWAVLPPGDPIADRLVDVMETACGG
jgi:hypothetical protein